MKSNFEAIEQKLQYLKHWNCYTKITLIPGSIYPDVIGDIEDIVIKGDLSYVVLKENHRTLYCQDGKTPMFLEKISFDSILSVDKVTPADYWYNRAS